MATLIVAGSIVEGSSLNVGDFLKLKHEIPPYQRDYVWTNKVVEQLWDDLIEHYKRYSVNELLPNPEGYFLGAMVVVGNSAGAPFEVVDGQQRLTTLSTIISVLFDLIERLNVPEPFKTGQSQTAQGCLGQFEGSDWESNIKFSDSDLAKFFINSCLNKRSKQDKEDYWNSQWCTYRLARKKSAISKLKQAITCGYDKLESFLNELSADDSKRNRLVMFFRMVTECVIILRITAHSHSNAYAIFESLNNRGIRLSQADLIKNELLKIANPSERDDIVDNWTQARQYIDSSDLLAIPDFLHFSYLSRYGRTKANDLYENVKKLVSSGNSSPATYAQEICEDAIAYDSLTMNFNSDWTAETHYMLNDIRNVLGVKLCYPFLFAVYRKYQLSTNEFESHVKLVMNFAFRFLKVIEGGIETLANTISDASILVNQGKSLAELSSHFKKNAPDAAFAQEFEKISFSNTKLAYFTVYYLEKVMMQGALPLPHGKEQNLEHIMPKSPNNADWAHIATEKASNPDQFKEYLWRIGNLIPLPESINKSLKNKGIHYKIQNGTGNEYSSQALTLMSPKEVIIYLDSNQWTYKSIDDRQRSLAIDYAVQAWPI